MNQQQWIARANKLHNNKFNYSEVHYVNSKTKVTIICPIHGKFEQVANSHLLGFGCAKCSIEASRLSRIKDATTYMAQLKGKKHNFTYEKTKYIDEYTPVIVTCKIHGDKTYMPKALLHSNCKGCVECNRMTQTITSNKKLIEQCNKVHNNKYSYDLVDLTTKRQKLVTVICPEHGEFKTTLLNHSKGSKCTFCMNEERSYRLRYNRLGIPSILYLCYFPELDLYKVGVTVNLKHRFRGEISKPKILYIKEYQNEAEAYFVEKELFKVYKNYKYKGPKVLKRSGNFELLTHCVLDTIASSVETIEITDEFKRICKRVE